MLIRLVAFVTAAVAGVLFPGSAGADTYTWNLSTGGSWDTSSANWTGAGTTWVNSTANNAVFNGQLLLITANQNITANTITFNADGSNVRTTNGSTLTVSEIATNFSSGSVSIGIGLAGSGGFTKSGTGTVFLNTACIYTGDTSVTGGTLGIASGSNRLPTTTNLSISAGARFLIGSGFAQQVAGLSGLGRVLGNGSSATTLTVTGTAGGSSFSGVLENGGTGGLAVQKTGTGTQTFGGSTANTYSSGTTISGGTLIAAKNSAFGTGSVSVSAGSTWGLSGGITQSNTGTSIVGTGAAVRVGAIDNISGSNALSGALTLSGSATIGATAGTLTLSGGVTLGANTVTFTPLSGANIIVQTTAITGTGGLTKAGAGTLTLSGASNYSGGTTISAGTLAINSSSGSGTGTGTVTVNGGTLVGTGTIAGAVSLTSGAIGAGTVGTAGQLTLQNGLTLATVTQFRVDITGTETGTGYDQINLTSGTANLAGATLSFGTLSGSGYVIGNRYVILDTPNNGIGGTFAGLANGTSVSALTGLGGFLDWSIFYDNAVGQVYLTPVPEPASVLGLGAASLALVGWGRKRRKVL